MTTHTVGTCSPFMNLMLTSAVDAKKVHGERGLRCLGYSHRRGNDPRPSFATIEIESLNDGRKFRNIPWPTVRKKLGEDGYPIWRDPNENCTDCYEPIYKCGACDEEDDDDDEESEVFTPENGNGARPARGGRGRAAQAAQAVAEAVPPFSEPNITDFVRGRKYWVPNWVEPNIHDKRVVFEMQRRVLYIYQMDDLRGWLERSVAPLGMAQLDHKLESEGDGDTSTTATILCVDVLIEGIDFNTEHQAAAVAKGVAYKSDTHVAIFQKDNIIVGNCENRRPMPDLTDSASMPEEDFLKAWTDKVSERISKDIKTVDVEIAKLQSEVVKKQHRRGTLGLLHEGALYAMQNRTEGLVARIKAIAGVQSLILSRSGFTLTTQDVFWKPNDDDRQKYSRSKRGKSLAYDQYFFGQYELNVNIDTGVIRYRNIRWPVRKSFGAPTHPHSDGQSDTCTGGFMQLLSNAYTNFDYYNLVLICLEFLRSVNMADGRGTENIIKFPKDIPDKTRISDWTGLITISEGKG